VKTDSIFYSIFQTNPGILFELLGQPSSRAQGYAFRSVEIKQLAFRIDGVLLPNPDAPDQTVWFIEVQFQKDLYFYHRFFAEIGLFIVQYPQTVDWQAAVLFPNRSVEPDHTHLHRAQLNSAQVHRIYLNELESRETLGVGLIQLILADSTAAVAQAQRLAARSRAEQTDEKPTAIIKLIETILIYKFPHLSRAEIENMFGLNELKQTKVYQEALQEGRQEGRQEGEATLVLRQLIRRFGDMTSETRSQIQSLPPAQLEALGEALLDFLQPSDLQNWMQSQSDSDRESC
jgi:predicted transposase/invertase (TIGR01784 family)